MKIHVSANGDYISVNGCEVISITARRINVRVSVTQANIGEWPTFSLNRQELEAGATLERKFNLLVQKKHRRGVMAFSTSNAAASTAAHLGRDWNQAKQTISIDQFQFALDTLRGLAAAGAVIPANDSLRAYVRELNDTLNTVPTTAPELLERHT